MTFKLKFNILLCSKNPTYETLPDIMKNSL